MTQEAETKAKAGAVSSGDAVRTELHVDLVRGHQKGCRDRPRRGRPENSGRDQAINVRVEKIWLTTAISTMSVAPPNCATR